MTMLQISFLIGIALLIVGYQIFMYEFPLGKLMQAIKKHYCSLRINGTTITLLDQHGKTVCVFHHPVHAPKASWRENVPDWLRVHFSVTSTNELDVESNYKLMLRAARRWKAEDLANPNPSL